MHTPWGKSQHSKRFGRGIVSYGTAGHGGFHVSKALLATMPDYMRVADVHADGNAGWFEEDSAWSLVTTCFPDRFTEQDREAAKETLRGTYPDAYERFYGVVLQPGESHAKDKRQFHIDHAGDYLVLSAFGDWHEKLPKGSVGVFAGKGGRTPTGQFPAECKWFLVPEAEYNGDIVLSRSDEYIYPEIEALA